MSGPDKYQEEQRAIAHARDYEGARQLMLARGDDPTFVDFVLAPRSPRAGKRMATTDANVRRLKAAHALYKQLRRSNVAVADAEAEMVRQFPMAKGTAEKLIRGGFNQRLRCHPF